jgi:hypothetical protein
MTPEEIMSFVAQFMCMFWVLPMAVVHTIITAENSKLAKVANGHAKRLSTRRT